MSSQADRRKRDRVKVILLTDDVDSKQKAENEGLRVATSMVIHMASFIYCIYVVYNKHSFTVAVFLYHN
jgi:hypothetical protein